MLRRGTRYEFDFHVALSLICSIKAVAASKEAGLRDTTLHKRFDTGGCAKLGELEKYCAAILDSMKTKCICKLRIGCILSERFSFTLNLARYLRMPTSSESE